MSIDTIPDPQAAVPDQNSTDNVTMSDVIGNKTDDEDGDSVYALLYEMHQHFHGIGAVYPTAAAGVTLTCDDDTAWDLGTITEVIPAGTVAEKFGIHFANLEALSANAVYEIVLYQGAAAAETEIARFRVVRTAVQNTEVGVPIITPLMSANTRVSAAVMSSSGNADTATISLEFHRH